MSSPESVRIKAILFGPIFILFGLGFLPFIFANGEGIMWQTRVGRPAAIVGGVALLWIGIRSKPESSMETGEAAADVTKDVVNGVFDHIL